MYRCPHCHQLISLADVNLTKDLALCRCCGQRSSSREVLDNRDASTADLAHPPKGTWLREEAGHFEVGASTRSKGACILIPFTLLWSWGLFGHVDGFRTVEGEFEWLLFLLLLPFMVATGFLISQCLMTVAGRVTVRLNCRQGVIFTGVGALGRRQHFRVSEVTAVGFGEAKWNSNYEPVRELLVVTSVRRLKFGRHLREAQQDFFAAALRARLGVG